MNINEKIALLGSVGIIMTEASEKEINDRIVDYFRQIDVEAHEFLISANSNNDEILDAAIAKIQEEVNNTGSSSTVLSADPYQSSSTGNTGGASGNANVSKSGETALGDITTKPKSTNNKEDVTSRLAGSMPTASRSKLDGLINQRWDSLMKRANGTSVGAYCVDTEVRKHLLNQSFVVNSDDYIKTFLEKYNYANVIDDNKYGEADANGKPTILEKGENMKSYEEIVNKLQNKGNFTVRVPEVQNQKVIGVLFNSTSGESKEIIKATKDVPIFVLTEMGGKVPGQPGIEVTGIVSTTSSKTKNGTVDTTERQTIAIKHRGKVDAMKTADSKYIRYTAKPVEAAMAKREYGAEKKEYSVSSTDSFKYKDNEGKDHVVRVRGKILVPFFSRTEEFSVFGPITAANRVETLSEADKGHVAKLYAAAINSKQLSYEFSAAAGLTDLVDDIEKSTLTPPLNLANVG